MPYLKKNFYFIQISKIYRIFCTGLKEPGIDKIAKRVISALNFSANISVNAKIILLLQVYIMLYLATFGCTNRARNLACQLVIGKGRASMEVLRLQVMG